jgi:hypothetical protein
MVYMGDIQDPRSKYIEFNLFSLKDEDFDFFPKNFCEQVANPFSLWQSNKSLPQKNNF